MFHHKMWSFLDFEGLHNHLAMDDGGDHPKDDGLPKKWMVAWLLARNHLTQTLDGCNQVPCLSYVALAQSPVKWL